MRWKTLFVSLISAVVSAIPMGLYDSLLSSCLWECGR